MYRSTVQQLFYRALAACAIAGFSPLAASAILIPPVTGPITISTVPVGDVGNANDPATGDVYGGVSYAYRIGTTEVTNTQYAAFLNAKAKSDPLGLYNANMGTNARGGITQSGSSGSFTYTTRLNMGNKPVNFVSWYDSLRFANWLNNGQGAGDTETGGYTLLGGTATPSNNSSITRNSSATWVLTNENEWYKSAYYQPASQGGDSDSYWRYPTRSNSTPTSANADSLGNISNPGANVVNYSNAAVWNGQTGNVTSVGSAGSLSDSYYGTADQGGNVQEWIESYFDSSRTTRGGSYSQNSTIPQANTQGSGNPANESFNIGFRVANVAAVPEPSTCVLAILGGATLLWWAKRRK